MSTFVPFPEEKGVEPLKEVLARLVVARGWGKISAQARLEALWHEVVGPEWKGHTQALAVKRGVLEVHVRDAVVHQHLVMRKEALRAAMAERLGVAIKSVRMRVGGVAGGGDNERGVGGGFTFSGGGALDGCSATRGCLRGRMARLYEKASTGMSVTRRWCQASHHPPPRRGPDRSHPVEY